MPGNLDSAITIVTRGRGWRLSCAQWVPHPMEAVFPFFASARNLERLTPGFLRFRVARAPSPALGEGALIDYRLRLHGIPIWWRTRIEDWEPPHRFVDIQVRGPFRHWRHQHEFRSHQSGTLMSDTVDFDLFLRPLYRTPALAWIKSDLRKIFDYRRTAIGEIFGDEDDNGQPPDPSAPRPDRYLAASRNTEGVGPRTSHTSPHQDSKTTA